MESEKQLNQNFVSKKITKPYCNFKKAQGYNLARTKFAKDNF